MHLKDTEHEKQEWVGVGKFFFYAIHLEGGFVSILTNSFNLH